MDSNLAIQLGCTRLPPLRWPQLYTMVTEMPLSGLRGAIIIAPFSTSTLRLLFRVHCCPHRDTLHDDRP